MTVQLSSLRVAAELDASQYTRAMAEKIAADRQGEASSLSVGQAMARQDVQLDDLGRGVSRLSRTYIEGYGQTAKFERELRLLENELSKGSLSAERATAVYDGLVRKFRQVGDAAASARRGSADMAGIIAAGPASAEAVRNGVYRNPVNDNAPRPVFRRDQYMNLSFQANDIATSLMSGMPAHMVAAQQGGQIFQILQTAEGGVTAGLKSLGGTLMGLVTPTTAAVAALGAVAGSMLALSAAAASVGENAKRVQMDTDRYQALRGAAYVGGAVDSDTFQTGMSSLGQKANTEFRQGEGELTKLLAANNQALTDRAGKVKDVNALLVEAATLVGNARTEFDKVDILRLFGLTDDWLKLLEKGPSELQRLQAEVANSGAVIDANLVQRAKEFDEAWGAAWRSFVLNAKSAATTAGGYMAAVLNMVNNQQQKNQRLEDVGAMLGRSAKGGRAEVDKFFAPEAAKIDAPVNFPKGGTIVPKSGSGGSAREKAAPRDWESTVKQFERQTRGLDQEITTFGQAADTVARYKAETELLAAAKRSNKQITPELTAQVEKLAGSYAKSTADLAKMRQEAQQSAQLQNWVGNEMLGIFDKLGQSGTTAISVLEDLGKSMAKLVLQAALMGTGPLAGLFGTAAEPGTTGTGGLVGMLAGALKGTVTKSANGNVMTEYGPLPLQKYANGGIARSPQLSLFGEGRQPEAYVPLPDGRSIPVTMRAPAPVAIPMPLQPSSGAGGAGGRAAAPNITINEAPGQRAEVSQDEEGNITIDMIADQMEARMASRAALGRGPMGRLMGQNPGIRRG